MLSNRGETIKVEACCCFQEQNDSEGGGWSQVAEVGAGERKAKIDGLNTGDRSVGWVCGLVGGRFGQWIAEFVGSWVGGSVR